MKKIVSAVLMTFFAFVMVLPLAEQHAAAQAPTGPQGGAAPPTVKPQAPATPQQQAPQGGVSITVEVPVVFGTKSVSRTETFAAQPRHRYLVGS